MLTALINPFGLFSSLAVKGSVHPVKVNLPNFSSIASITSDGNPIDLMDVAFIHNYKTETAPLRIDLSGVAHNLEQQTSARIGSCSSSRSTEFQTVLDGFSTLEINEITHKNETTKPFGENGDASRLLNRRRNSTELTPGDLVMGFSQAPQRVRRKSLPSLGLVAVDIQCSVPTKMKNSQSFPSDMLGSIIGGDHELQSIQEIPGKRARRNSNFKGVPKETSKPEGSFQRGRRLSLSAQRNMNTSSSLYGFRANQRRVSCSKITEKPSKWCVKVHERSLDISDDEDKLYPHIQSRRASYAGFSSFSRQPQGRAGLLPKIGRRNSLVNEGKQSPTYYKEI
ncbi:hypothetical protein ACROYT_G040011 [Oculina patagonica]